jgi:HD-GYP domain-containing protein (c-di-GMP phosphodiesterase class II)
MTTDRPYRRARSWEHAIDEILAEDGRQFDPRVVSAFAIRERRLRRLHDEFAHTPVGRLHPNGDSSARPA